MIAIGCDHAALEYKAEITKYLSERGYACKDFGCYKNESCDYPDYAECVAESVASGECEKGLLICGTGIGMSIAANKVKGIRCAHCCDAFSAKACREHNDANVLAIGARTTGLSIALDIVKIFLSTPFSGEARHIARIAKISEIERKYSK